jgi:hypothetical protein
MALPAPTDWACALQCAGAEFSACIPKAETPAFSKIVLKGALAEGLYWLSKASENRTPAAS